MNNLVLKAPAKINLGLSVLGKLPNGYHEVKTIYAQVSLFDVLKFREIEGGKIEIRCDDRTIPTDEGNLVYRAAGLIKSRAGTKKGIKIFLEKKIPVGSGLGGGSADAAATLKGLNQLWRLNLSLGELVGLGRTIGADVAFSLVGGVQLEIQGGEKAGEFTSLPMLPLCHILVCFPDIKIESGQAYSQVEYDKIGKNNLSLLTEAIRNKSLVEIARNLHNDFELWTLKKYPLLGKIKDEILKHGALGSSMSGKGSTIYGVFDSIKKAEFTRQFLRRNFKSVFLVGPYYDSEKKNEKD